MSNLTQGKNYLVEDGTKISKITVREVTGTAYNISDENGKSTWIDKSEFDTAYRVKENLSEGTGARQMLFD